jgi:hypothetical protein
VERSERREEDKLISKRSGRDWNIIPVGLPFTEMVAKAKNFTTTTLETQTATVRQTVMQPKQVRCTQHGRMQACSSLQLAHVLACGGRV